MKRKKVRRIDFVGPVLPPGVFRVAKSTVRTKRPWGARSAHPETGVQTHLGVFESIDEAWESVRTFTPAKPPKRPPEWEEPHGGLPKGVTRVHGSTPDTPSPWQAKLWMPLERRTVYLGRFPTVEEARMAYEEASKSKWKPREEGGVNASRMGDGQTR
jgi:hypothetical protein